MARKRGGLAGLYDRNKGVIQTVSPFLAGALGGPLAGAAVGAAMKGFDRPGKGGVGFDLGEGLKGGISGYGAGSLGASAKGALQKRLAERLITGTGGAKTLASTQGLIDQANAQIIPQLSGAASSASAVPSAGFNAQQYLADAATSGPSKVMQLGKNVSTKTPPNPGRLASAKSGLSRAAAFAEKNPNIVAGLAKGAMGDPAAELEMQKYRDEQERLQRRAGLIPDLLTGGSGEAAFGRLGPGLNSGIYGSMDNLQRQTAPGAFYQGPPRTTVGLEDDENEPFGRPLAPRMRQTRTGQMFSPGMR